METKICAKCGEEKGIKDFYKHAYSKDGYDCYCKVCKDKNNQHYEKIRKEKKLKRESFYVESLKNEEWRDIQGYEGLYQVSNLGRVKGLKKEVKCGKGYVTKKEIILSQQNRHGYMMTRLSKNNKRTTFIIHRLVAQAFIPNTDNKKEVNHIDGNKQNNCVSNLEWATRSENQLHAYKTGLQTQANRKRNDYRSKPVLQILNGITINEFPSAMEASRETGFSQGGISSCCRGSQKHFKGYEWKLKD